MDAGIYGTLGLTGAGGDAERPAGGGALRLCDE